MKNVLVCVFDRKAQMCASPVLFRNTDEAKRAFSMAILKDPMLSQFPEDYDIIKIADFDIESGDLVSSKVVLCSVKDLIVVSSLKEGSGSVSGKFPVSPSSSEVDSAFFESYAKEISKSGGFKK